MQKPSVASPSHESPKAGQRPGKQGRKTVRKVKPKQKKNKISYDVTRARLVDFMRQEGRPLRAWELRKNGFHAMYIKMFSAAPNSPLVQVSRGCYRLREDVASDLSYLAIATLRWKDTIVCGPTAAFYHGLIKDPGEIWLATRRGHGRPDGLIDNRQIRVREWGDERRKMGVQTIVVDGKDVQIVSPAFAVAELVELSVRNKYDNPELAVQAFINRGGNLRELNDSIDQICTPNQITSELAVLLGRRPPLPEAA